MVAQRALSLALAALAAALTFGEASPAPEAKGPVLYGDGAGRLWKWEGGEKTYLSGEGQNLVLGGVGEKQLWGWAVNGDRARFFTLELPKKKGAASAASAEKAKAPPPAPVFDARSYPTPDRADRVGDRLLFVYGAASGSPRYEVWKAGALVQARAWDDGRSVYALSLGPVDGWIIAGRDAGGAPWLEVSGVAVVPPDGWRGRLTVALWASDDEKSPALPRAAGWGAPEGSVPAALLWGPEGWSQPTPDAEANANAGVYPLLGAAAKGAVVLAGWRADSGTGALRPWFWDGTKAQTAGGAADGQPQAFGSGKGGAFLIVRHQSQPWFTREDGKDSVPLDGLDSDDRVVAVQAEASPSSP